MTISNMTQIDYDREMAFVAIRNREERPEIIGAARNGRSR